MGIITLVSYIVAREGYVFAFSGEAPQCSNCRFRKVCVERLKKGHVYRIVRVLNIRNRCPINEYVVTVEVEEEAVPAAIPSNVAVEGMTIKYSKIDCDLRDCPYYSICRPKLLPDNCKVKIVSVKGRIKCLKGIPLKEALVLVAD